MSQPRLYQIVRARGATPEWLSLEPAKLMFNAGYGESDLTMRVREPDGIERAISPTEMSLFRARERAVPVSISGF